VSLLPSLALAVVVTWMAKTAFIVLLPADRLPSAVTDVLAATTPAVLAALTVITLLDVVPRTSTQLGLGLPLRTALPLVVAAVLAARRVSLAWVVLGALATGTALSLLPL
jgi:branched-subunit amino acid transport protein